MRVLQPSIRERGAQVASAQAGAPQSTRGASFGEAAFANMSKGKAYLIFLWECRNVASRDDLFAIFFQEVVAKVAHLTVEAFVLSGSHALRPMPHNLSWGLASARWRGYSVHEGQAHFLVLGEFCQVALED